MHLNVHIVFIKVFVIDIFLYFNFKKHVSIYL